MVGKPAETTLQLEPSLLVDAYVLADIYEPKELSYYLGRSVVVIYVTVDALVQLFKRVIQQLEATLVKDFRYSFERGVTEPLQPVAVKETVCTHKIESKRKPLKAAIWRTFNYRPGKKVPAHAKIAEAYQKKLSNTDLATFGSGIENGGNTCYISSILQALRFMPTFRERLDATPMKKIELGNELKKLYSIIEGTSECPPRILTDTEINEFRKACMAYGWKPERETTQEDARHFKQFLLEQLGFSAFTYKTHIKCQDDNPYRDVDVPALERQGGTENHIVLPLGKATEDTNLSGLVGGASVVEEVFRKEVPTCEDRTDLPECVKLLTQQRIELSSGDIPQLLPITLKRHGYDRQSLTAQKVMTSILPSFTLEIPLRDTSNVFAHYSLKSIVVHDGISPHSGHYRAFIPIKHQDTYRFASYDDSQSKVLDTVQIEDTIRKNGYIYFYQLERVGKTKYLSHERRASSVAK